MKKRIFAKFSKRILNDAYTESRCIGNGLKKEEMFSRHLSCEIFELHFNSRRKGDDFETKHNYPFPSLPPTKKAKQ